MSSEWRSQGTAEQLHSAPFWLCCLWDKNIRMLHFSFICFTLRQIKEKTRRCMSRIRFLIEAFLQVLSFFSRGDNKRSLFFFFFLFFFHEPRRSEILRFTPALFHMKINLWFWFSAAHQLFLSSCRTQRHAHFCDCTELPPRRAQSASRAVRAPRRNDFFLS